MCPTPTWNELRERLLVRIDPDWRCGSCSHDGFFVHPDFAALSRCAPEADGAPQGVSFCMQLVCTRCGSVSLHSNLVLSGALDEQIAAAGGKD